MDLQMKGDHHYFRFLFISHQKRPGSLLFNNASPSNCAWDSIRPIDGAFHASLMGFGSQGWYSFTSFMEHVEDMDRAWLENVC